ncbi:hypothetical protein GDO86_012593 [Hymenochirus boettgeri]|uniref:Uncharacterized protein n=1 Tax=Hymenochirus boettgeri TaxID=247094 RepID=A0A8T2IQL7_9PIPI|nr:hypothetical protein GDO86_012593 [Hymenochirus boettgeri]
MMVFRKRRKSSEFKLRYDPQRWFTLDEESSNFSYTDMDKVETAGIKRLSSKSGNYDVENSSYGDFSQGVYKPKLDKVDSLQSVHINRPYMIPPSNEQN